jgi:hypothetical protein
MKQWVGLIGRVRTKKVYHGDTEGTEKKEVRSEKNLTARIAMETQRPQGERVTLCDPCVSIAMLAVKFLLFSPCNSVPSVSPW